MRRFLDTLYGVAGLLAGLCMIGVLASVLAAIIARQMGWNIPGTDAYAGYFLAAAGLLALAPTFTHGEHISVTLLLNSPAAPRGRRSYLFAPAAGPAPAVASTRGPSRMERVCLSVTIQFVAYSLQK